MQQTTMTQRFLSLCGMIAPILFVFVAILAGYLSVPAVFVAAIILELVRSFSNLYFPNTWQLALGIFLLIVIIALPGGLGSLLNRRKETKS